MTVIVGLTVHVPRNRMALAKLAAFIVGPFIFSPAVADRFCSALARWVSNGVKVEATAPRDLVKKA